MSVAKRLKVLFYGDDFTGASENLAQFHRSGAKCKMYIGTPSESAILRDEAEFDVLGFAGTARALGPDEMRAELARAFSVMARLECALVQYKICSTFDSSPVVGSFGVALSQAREFFGARAVAVLAATPDFGRYTVFGNHFARFGEGIERLDRHPSMSKHPRTPMGEADLLVHLSKQTKGSFRKITIPEIRRPENLARHVSDVFREGLGAIFDGVDNEDLLITSRLLWKWSRTQPLFALAAQGLAQFLGEAWAESDALEDPQPVATAIPPVANLLVLSGSCALQNGRQIEVAEQSGWLTIHLDPASIGSATGEVADRLSLEVLGALAVGKPVIVYTARGRSGRLDGSEVPAEMLGALYAEVARLIRSMFPLQRIVFAGGDSSSYAVRSIGAEAIEIAVFDKEQSSHVCRLRAPAVPAVDGLEVMLKGGQVGKDDYFLRVLSGTC